MNKEVFVNGSDVCVQTNFMSSKKIWHKSVTVFLSLKKGEIPYPTLNRTRGQCGEECRQGIMPEDRERDRHIAHVRQCHQPTWSQREEWLAHIYQNLYF